MKNKLTPTNIQESKTIITPFKIAGHPYKVINPGDSLRTIIGIPIHPQRKIVLKINIFSAIVPE